MSYFTQTISPISKQLFFCWHVEITLSLSCLSFTIFDHAVADGIDVISCFSPSPPPLLICHFLFQTAACKREVDVSLLFGAAWGNQPTHPVSVVWFWSSYCRHRCLSESVNTQQWSPQTSLILTSFCIKHPVLRMKESSRLPSLHFVLSCINNTHVSCGFHNASGRLQGKMTYALHAP